MLMEKAYAKMHKGYEELEGGSEIYALVDMTGGAPDTVELDSAENAAKIKDGKLWDEVGIIFFVFILRLYHEDRFCQSRNKKCRRNINMLNFSVVKLTKKKMMTATQNGWLLGCAFTDPEAPPEADTGTGIMMNHAYGVLELQIVNNTKLMRVRNPWGMGEWNGPWSDGSKEWTKEIQLRLK